MKPADARLLLAWFAAHRRDLPWRGEFPRDPYPVLVSEVMLQQTQVDRVVEGFRRFVERFPTVEALAAATSDAVVEAFSGMGYYGRARRLHLAARASRPAANGRAAPRGSAALPGVGAYTSAAVAAFAFAGADPPVDGNVCRVAARVLRLRAAHRLGAAGAGRGGDGARAAYPGALPRGVRGTDGAGCHRVHATRPRAVRRARCAGAAAVTTRRSGSRWRGRHGRRWTFRWVVLWLRPGRRAVLLRRVPDGTLLAGLWLPPLTAIVPGAEARDAAAVLARADGFAVDPRERGVRAARDHPSPDRGRAVRRSIACRARRRGGQPARRFATRRRPGCRRRAYSASSRAPARCRARPASPSCFTRTARRDEGSPACPTRRPPLSPLTP